MNTQTHVLLAVSFFGSSGMLAIFKRRLNITKQVADGGIQKIVISGLIFGALLPDLSLFIMFGYAQLLNLPHSVIWGEMYYSPFWQSLGAISNSIPIFFLAGAISWMLMKNAEQSALSKSTSPDHTINRVEVHTNELFLLSVCAIALAALVHAITDLPLHHDDGHPHFWPMTNWIYSSPVSYWDDRHYAAYWTPVEIALGLLCVVVLWRRYSPLWSKLLLVLAALGYALPYYLFSNG